MGFYADMHSVNCVNLEFPKKSEKTGYSRTGVGNLRPA